MMAVTYERVMEVASLLVEDGSNAEYTRGIAELISDLFGEDSETVTANLVHTPVSALGPYELRLEAERIIGEDRVPTDVLRELVRDYGETGDRS